MTFEIRPLRLDEMVVPVEWAAREGWNPGLSDAEAFWRQDPEGFVGGFLDGELIATISAIRYGADFGFVGFYIVAPPWRGQGYGIRVWDAGLDHLADVRTVGLDGVVDQQHNYRRSGFVLAHRNVRYAGVAPLRLDAMGGQRSATLVPAADVDPAVLERYDAEHFGAQRSDFLRAWTTNAGHRALVAFAVAGDGTVGDVAGYGVIRPCREGFKVGPLFATDAATAVQLIEGLMRDVTPGTGVFVDPPTVNAEAVHLSESLGMSPVFETARMYRGEPLALPIDEVFGITTFELG